MGGPRTILVVDDDKNDVYLLQVAIEDAGLAHKLVHVLDGQQGIDYLAGKFPFTDRVRYPYPNLLLLDLKMPMVDGFDVLAFLRSGGLPSVPPVVVLSSSFLNDDIQRARSLGAQDYIVKPSKFNEYIKLVQKLDRDWLRLPAAALFDEEPGAAAATKANKTKG
jgi:CheY-like chemotaxis protein